MKQILVALLATCVALCVTVPYVQASTVVDIPSPAGTYAPVDVHLDAPGTITINTPALAQSGHYVTAGPCVLTTAPAYNSAGRVNGAKCSGPGSVHFTTTGQLTSTCPVDGGVSEGLHITIKVNGIVQYDQQLWPNPVQCWTTPAKQAATSWAAPVLTFNNVQARPSAATTFTLTDPSWNYSEHTFTVPVGLVCNKNLVDINPSRWITTLAERGFKCSGVVPASTALVVTIF